MKTPPADEARTVQVRAHGRSRETDRPCNSIFYSLSETVRLTKVSRRTVILRRDRMRTEGLSKSSDNEPSSPAGVIVIAALKAEQELGA